MTALGAALYHDTWLVESTSTLSRFLDVFFSGEEKLSSFCVPLAPRRERPSAYRKAKLLERVERNQLASFLVATPADTPDPDQLTAGFGLVPTTVAAEEGRAGYRYRVDVAVGEAALARRGAAAIVDALVGLAGSLTLRAGAVFAADTAAFAYALASGTRGGLTPEQDVRVRDVFYAVHELGDRVRGPEWGTLLAAHHVDRLGGIDHVRRESGCETVEELPGGGAYLQVTATLPAPDDAAFATRLARLRDFLTPVR